MGWWVMESNTEFELVLGDDPLEIADEMLTRMSQVYQEDLQRKPRLEEVLKALEFSIAVVADRYLLDFEERELVEIRARTRKRRKRQAYAVGDYFAVPLGPKQYGFGRIIDDHPKYGILIVLFDVVSTRKLRQEELKNKPGLFPPIYAGMDEAWTEWRWKVIKGTPIKPGEYLTPKFKIKGLLPGEGWRIREGDKVYPATKEEVAGLEVMGLWPPERIEDRMRKALGIETEPGT
jgi:hypothetical protein